MATASKLTQFQRQESIRGLRWVAWLILKDFSKFSKQLFLTTLTNRCIWLITRLIAILFLPRLQYIWKNNKDETFLGFFFKNIERGRRHQYLHWLLRNMVFWALTLLHFRRYFVIFQFYFLEPWISLHKLTASQHPNNILQRYRFVI